MSDYIPIGIMEQVLLRLPMKTLMQCTSVCKTWYNLIITTDFISKHSDFTKSVNNSTLFWVQNRVEKESDDKSTHFCVIYSDDFKEYGKFKVRPQDKIVASCNGLICLKNIEHGVVICNPLIGKCLSLPRNACFVNQTILKTFGFVFDHIRNDYKVLTLLESLNDNVPSIVEVFRLSTGLWECISHETPIYQIFEHSLQADLKGVAHWIGLERNAGLKIFHFELKIISFDVHQEVFGSIGLPVDVVNDSRTHGGKKFLLVFEELLFLIVVIDHGLSRYDVWRMGEYNVVESWERVGSWDFGMGARPLGFRKNGEILWLDRGRRLLSTNGVDNSYKYIGECQIARWESCLHYVESLTLLNKKFALCGKHYFTADAERIKILQE